MKFSKDYQPKNNGRKKVADRKVPMSVSVKKSTKDYFANHKGEGGNLLDEYVEQSIKGGIIWIAKN